MDGDLFGGEPPADTTTSTVAVPSSSDASSLLDFASPPPSQETSNGFDTMVQQQQQQPQDQETNENLLNFGASDPTHLFGGPQLLVSSPNMTPNATPQPQSQAQPVDLFGSTLLSSTTPTPSCQPMDAFAAVAAPVVSSTADDPFAVFLEPQSTTPQQAADSDPFSAHSGDVSMPSPPQPSTISSTDTTKPVSIPTGPSLMAQAEPVSTTIQETATAIPPTEDSNTSPGANPIVPIVEEEKKDQESLMVTVELSKEGETMAAVTKNSKKSDSIESTNNKEDALTTDSSSPDVATGEGSATIVTPEIPMAEPNTLEQTSTTPINTEPKPHELDLVANLPEEAPSTLPTPAASASDPASMNNGSTAVSAKQIVASSTPQNQQELLQSPPNASKFLSTMTKSPKFSQKKAPAVANRFAGFKSMAESMAQKGAERVAKVKDQIQKEELEGSTKSNRFAGFKNMAESMAQKGAERVAKVKDQIQKEDADHANAKQRFAGLKTMAAKGAERVAKVKDQIQKDDSIGGQNAANAKQRLAGFKNMAGNIAARGAKSVASVQVPQQLTSVQVPQRFNTANLSLFGKGTKAIENSASNSSYGLNTAAAAVAPKSSQETVTPTATKHNDNLSASTSTATLSETRSSPQPQTKDQNSTDEEEQPQNSGISSTSFESIPKANNVEESVLQKSSEVDKIVSDETKSTDDNRIENADESQDTLAEPSTTAGNDKQSESQNAASSPAKDSSLESNPVESEETMSNSGKTEANSHTVSKIVVESSHSGLMASNATTQIDDPSPSKPIDASNETSKQQVPTETQKAEEFSHQVEALKKELDTAQTRIMELQHNEDEEKRKRDTEMLELQAKIQKEMVRRAEAEEKTRVVVTKSKKIEEEYKAFKTESKSNLDEMTSNMESLTKAKDAIEKELVDIREERDEQARKEMALTTRLNAAKKKEAVKANAAEHYGEQVDQLELAVKEYGSQIETLTAEREQLKVELGEWKEYAEKRTSQLEMALNDEKKLNDERKRKMKGFIEAKTEEVRAAKADYISLQTELDQNSHSLTELNQRYKQLHAQWVQSQTRNRELQRDAMKMKKDSEKMHKVGGSLEARLSRSAQQSEDHKNKRIEARNELMSVLGQLEAERNVNSRLQEAIKMTFTPKALSQQQTIQEALDDFEAALQKLSLRIGRPLPPTFSSNDPGSFADGLAGTNEADSVDMIDNSKQQGTVTLSEINSNKALQKLENETKRVSENIVKFSASVEQMHSLLDGGGTKSCVDVLSQILMSGNSPGIASPNPRRKISGGQPYGQISRNMP